MPIYINGVPVSLSQVAGRVVATVGVFGLVTIWADNAVDALGQATKLLNLHDRQSAA